MIARLRRIARKYRLFGEVIDFLEQLFQQLGKDHVGAFAASLAYNMLFAIFPLLIFLTLLLGIFHATSLVSFGLHHLHSLLPSSTLALLQGMLTSITKTHQTGGLKVGAVFSLLISLWGTSTGFRAFMDASNEMYDIEEHRPFWKVYFISFVLSIIVFIFLIGSLLVLLAGLNIAIALSISPAIWNIISWPILLIFTTVIVAVLYYIGPNTQQNFRLISPGSVFFVAIWVLFSVIFSSYVSHIGIFNAYGALASSAIFLLYLYYTSFILLVGEEINQILESKRGTYERK